MMNSQNKTDPKSISVKLAALDREIEANNLSLTDLENLAMGGTGVFLPTAIAVTYETQYVEDAALSFLADPGRDTQLLKKNADAELAEMLMNAYAAPLPANMVLAEMRKTFARHVLSTELMTALGDETPAGLKGIATPKERAVAERCSELAHTWRNRLDLGSSYEDAAREVEKSLHLAAMDFPVSALSHVESFPDLERQLLLAVARNVAAGSTIADLQEVEKVASERRAGFWALREAELQPRWDLVLRAAELLRLCRQIDADLKTPMGAAAIANAYTKGAQPWYRLDTLHRHFERKASSLEFLLTEQPAEIEQLVTTTRRCYAETAGRMAEVFVRALSAANFDLAGWYRQTQTFERAVAPEIGTKRIAYFMVDALRYELARELGEMLSVEFDVEFEGVAGTMPGITDVGMAALLPYASTGFTVSADKRNDLEVRISDVILDDREDRIAYLEKRAGVPFVSLKLEDPKLFKSKLKKLGDGPGLVVVTSREIDRAGEEDLTEARRYMDDVLRQIRLALYVLAKAGINDFVIATDHGYLFGEDLDESDKIDAPGGRTVLIHRRIWVGEGGVASDSFLRTSLKKMGIQSELEMAVPWNLAAFKAPGSEAYFHGGLSPQEFLLPLMRLRSKSAAKTGGTAKISWELKVGSAVVTSVHLTVTVLARAGFFDVEWPRVRVEVRSASEPCAIAVSASYNFSDTTGEIALRGLSGNAGEVEPNAVTLMLTPKAPQKGTISIHLVDAVSGVELMKPVTAEVSRVF